MAAKRDVIVFEYANPEGAWTVAVEEAPYHGLLRIVVSDGKHNTLVPLLLNDTQIKHTLLKLKRIPGDRVTCYDLFSACVAGAASLSIKYDR